MTSRPVASSFLAFGGDGAAGRAASRRLADAALRHYPSSSPVRMHVLKAICERHPGCTIESHMQRLLEAMGMLGEVSVPEARGGLGLSNPSQTMTNLRKAAITVCSEPVMWTDCEGNRRRTAAYSLGEHD
jgi:hypothetical protein